jgi:hypothetical protein
VSRDRSITPARRRPGSVGVKAGLAAGVVHGLVLTVASVVYRDRVERALADSQVVENGPLSVELFQSLSLVAGPLVSVSLVAVVGSVCGVALGRLDRQTPRGVVAGSLAVGLLLGFQLNVPGGRAISVGASLSAWAVFAAVFVRLYEFPDETEQPTVDTADRTVGATLVAAGLFGVGCLLAVQALQGVFPSDFGGVAAAVGRSLLVNGTLVAVSVSVGLRLGDAVGLGAPRLRRWLTDDGPPVSDGWLAPAVVLGLGAGGVVTALDLAVFAPLARAALRDAPSAAAGGETFSPLAGLLVSVYGGVTEELLLRYGLLTGVVWLLGRVVDASEPAVVWTGIVLTSVAFGVSHLPATAAVFELTPAVVGRALVLNGIAGVAFGWLYWRHGLVAAVVAHLGTDIVLELVVPVVV